jgi:hypothetical protein
MASAPKLVSVDRRRQSPLTPEMKAFIDRAIVPILVKEYLALTELENELAMKPPRERHSASRTSAPRPRNVNCD